MSVQWTKDADAALAQAKTSDKPVLIDFSAAQPGLNEFFSAVLCVSLRSLR